MNKLALITGASRGIGLSIADYFSSKGYDLILVSKNDERLELASKNLSSIYGNKIYPVAVDLREYDQVSASLRTLISDNTPVDVVVNAAGIFKFGTSELSTTDMIEMLEVNFNSMHNICSLIRDNIILSGNGFVFNLSSIAGVETFPFIGGYAATKHAIVGYSQCLAKELKRYNVKVTAICPDVVNTDMSSMSSIPKQEMIPVSDIAQTVDYIMNLSKNALVDCVTINCSYLDSSSDSR